ncbi:MAG: hypothetical protein JXA90_10465, partial [Planctomycetes bacterium]|nr:hypothetical protein [Planctomycetota bacterium]
MSRAASRIAVVMGGISVEREVSLRTGLCVVSRLAARHRVKPVVIEADGRWRVARGYTESPEPPCGAGPSSWSAAEPLPILEALQLLIADRV